VYDYEAYWITHIQPQAADFKYEELAFRFYEGARRLGLDIDIVAPGASLEGYKLVLVPTLPHVSEAALKAFEAASGTVLYGPRTGSKTRHLAIPEGLAPGPIRELTGARVTQVSSLRPNLSDKVSGKVNGTAKKWREYMETSATVVARFENGDAAFTAKGKHHYLACVPDEKLLASVMGHVCKNADLKTVKLPAHIRLRKRGDLMFAFNYGNTAWMARAGTKMVLGKRSIAPQSLGIWKA
jgi:beta-galactosidase